MEEERRVLEDAIRVSAKQQARAEVMRVEMERQVESERQDAEEEAVWMEVERQAATMKRPLDISFRFFPINFSLEFSFRLCKIDFSLEFSFRPTFQISDWLQLDFIFIPDCCLKKCKNFRFQISDWSRLLQIGFRMNRRGYLQNFLLVKMPGKCGQFFYNFLKVF